MEDEYEALVTAIAMIDGAGCALEQVDAYEDERQVLHDMRNGLNQRRLACLGNGTGRPFSVFDALGPQSS